MAKGDPIPDSDHVIRHISPTKMINGFVDGSAFVRRKSEIGLSVEWLERAGASLNDQLITLRKTMRRTLKKSHRLAELQVKSTRDHVRDNTSKTVDLIFAHEPLSADSQWPENPFHTEILQAPDPDTPLADLVGDLIARSVNNLHPAV